MYQIFSTTFFSKSIAFNGDIFASLDDVQAKLKNLIAFFDIDEENDAADFVTKGGDVYQVERVSA